MDFSAWEAIDGPKGRLFEIGSANENTMFCQPWSRDRGSSRRNNELRGATTRKARPNNGKSSRSPRLVPKSPGMGRRPYDDPCTKKSALTDRYRGFADNRRGPRPPAPDKRHYLAR